MYLLFSVSRQGMRTSRLPCVYRLAGFTFGLLLLCFLLLIDANELDEGHSMTRARFQLANILSDHMVLQVKKLEWIVAELNGSCGACGKSQLELCVQNNAARHVSSCIVRSHVNVQAAPAFAVLWGRAFDKPGRVGVKIDGQAVSAASYHEETIGNESSVSTYLSWKLVLPPQSAGGTCSICSKYMHGCCR